MNCLVPIKTFTYSHKTIVRDRVRRDRATLHPFLNSLL